MIIYDTNSSGVLFKFLSFWRMSYFNNQITEAGVFGLMDYDRVPCENPKEASLKFMVIISELVPYRDPVVKYNVFHHVV